MSLILEALRKSEAERQRGRMPDLHAELPPVPMRTTAAPWRWQLAFPAVALLALAAWLATSAWRSHATTDATTPPIMVSTKRAPTLPRVTHLQAMPQPTFTSTSTRMVTEAHAMPVARAATAAPAPPHAAATAHDADVRDAADTAAAPDLPMRAPASQPMAASAQPPPTRDSDSAPLQLADLAPQERKALPPLRLSMHLWNDDPSRRFVILDGNRLGEGDRLGNLVVTAIVHDGVLLDWNGRALKVPLR